VDIFVIVLACDRNVTDLQATATVLSRSAASQHVR